MNKRIARKVATNPWRYPEHMAARAARRLGIVDNAYSDHDAAEKLRWDSRNRSSPRELRDDRRFTRRLRGDHHYWSGLPCPF